MRVKCAVGRCLALSLAATLFLNGCALEELKSLRDDVKEDLVEGGQDLEELAEQIDEEFGKQPSEEQDDATRFREYTDEMFREEIVKNTINLHYTVAYPENYGIDEYEPTLGDFSLQALEDSYDDVRALKEDLSAFDVSALDEEEQLVYAMMQDFIETELSSEDMVLYYEPLSAYSGYQMELPILLAEYPFRTKRDVTDYLALLSEVDVIFTQIAEYEKVKSDAGLFMADYTLDGVVESCEDFIKTPEENYLISTFDERMEEADFLSEEEKKEYKKQNRDKVLEEVIPAYRSLIDGIEGLRGTGKNDKGLCHLEKGREYYEYLLRSEVGSDRDIEKLMQQTSDFIDNRMMNIGKILSHDPSLYDQYLNTEFPETEPEAIMEDLIQKSGEIFPSPPEVNYTIKIVEPSMQEHLNPAFYLSPPLDDVQNNTIYINPKYDDRSELYITLAHEGYPGHLYQMVSDRGYERLAVRNLFGYAGYTEGWATYAENMMYSLSGLQDDLALMLRYDNEFSLAVSAYADLGVNYYGWSRKELADYLTDIGAGTEETADEIFEVVVDMPGEYLKYYVGYLEFLDIRNTANKILDRDFDIRAFHEYVISLGELPFPLVKERVVKWASEQ